MARGERQLKSPRGRCGVTGEFDFSAAMLRRYTHGLTSGGAAGGCACEPEGP